MNLLYKRTPTENISPQVISTLQYSVYFSTENYLPPKLNVHSVGGPDTYGSPTDISQIVKYLFKKTSMENSNFSASPSVEISQSSNDKDGTSNSSESDYGYLIENPILMISSPPGMGKTLLAKQLVRTARLNFSDKKIYEIQMSNAASYFAERHCDDVNLTSFLQNQCRAVRENVDALIIDGFDEIRSYYRDTVKRLLQEMVKAKIRLVITTRPQEEEAIKTDLAGTKVSKIEIKPLGEEGQLELLSLKLKKARTECEKIIETFRKSNMQGLLENPMYLTMIAEIFEDVAKEHELNLFTIYYKIVMKRIANSIGPNRNVPEEGRVRFLLAEAATISFRDRDFSKFSKEDIEKLNKTGLLTIQNDKSSIKFIHQTITEFLFLLPAIKLVPNSVDKQLTYKEIMLDKELQQTRCFLDSLLATQKDLLDHRLTTAITKMTQIIKKEDSQHALENLCKEGLLNLFNSAANEIVFSPKKDLQSEQKAVVKGGHKLFLLASNSNEDLAFKILDMGFNLQHVYQCENQFLINLVRQVVENNYIRLFKRINDSCPLKGALCTYMNDFAIAQGKLVDPLVHIAIGQGSIEMMRLLLETGEDIRKVNADGRTALHIAALNSKLKMVQYFVGKKLNTLQRDNYGNNALHLASQKGQLENVKYFLQQHPKVIDETNNKKWTALHYAAGNSHCSTLKFLIQSGADLKAKNETGRTVLHFAARHCCLECVKLILDKDTSLLEVKTNEGYNILLLAACNSKLEMVKYLVGRKLNPLHKANDGKNALHLASQKGQLENVKYFLQQHPKVIDETNNQKWTALHHAASYSHCSTLKFLIESGANLKAKEETGWTVLHFAARSCCLECVKLIVDKDSSLLEVKTNGGLNVLHLAACNSKLEMVKYLVQKKVKPLDKTDYGDNALHLASQKGQLENVKYFLQQHPKVINETNNQKWTALHHAASYSHCSTLKFLIESGANLKAKEETGWTVLHFAARSCCLESVKLIVDKDASLLEVKTNGGLNVLHLAACNSKLEMVKYLVQKKVKPLDKTDYGDNALHLASQKGQLENVKYFLQQHPEVINETNNKKWTALHKAARNSHCSTLKFLIESDADLKAKTETGRTVLHFAARHCCLECVKLIVDKDASLLEVKTNGGLNVLHLAACNSKLEMVKYLVQKKVKPLDKTDYGDNALHLASQEGQHENVKYFLQQHPKVINETNNKKWTALHHAARNSHCSTLKFLIESGANLKAKEETGWTVLHFAARYCCLDCVELIVDKDELILKVKTNEGFNVLHLAACNSKEDIVKFLVEKGMDPNYKDDDAENALYKAAKYDNLENVKYLLELGVFQECDVKSALNNAFEKGHGSIVKELSKYLLKYKPDRTGARRVSTSGQKDYSPKRRRLGPAAPKEGF